MGLSASEAYKAAYPAATPSNAAKNTSRLTKNDDIQREVQRIRAAAAELPGSAFLTIQEKRNFLARVVRSSLSELPPDSDLWQEVSTTDAGTKRKMPCKLKAIAMDNDLAGEGSEAKAADAVSGSIADIMARIRSKR